MSEQSNIGPNKIRLKHVLISISLFSFLGLFIFVGINLETGSFSCGFVQEEIPIPEYLVGSNLVFEKPAYFGKTSDTTHTCVDAFQRISGEVQMIWPEFNEILTPNNLPENKEFSIYKRVYISCASISCMDGGKGGDTLLLKDEQGIIYEIDPHHFDTNAWAKAPQYLFKAGYYKDGVRLGDVVMERAWPTK